MATIDITRSHRLGVQGAHRVVDALADDLAYRLQVSKRWEDGVLRFSRTGAEGHIDVGENVVHVHVELGLTLSAIKSVVEQQIREYLDQRLGPS